MEWSLSCFFLLLVFIKCVAHWFLFIMFLMDVFFLSLYIYVLESEVDFIRYFFKSFIDRFWLLTKPLIDWFLLYTKLRCLWQLYVFLWISNRGFLWLICSLFQFSGVSVLQFLCEKISSVCAFLLNLHFLVYKMSIGLVYTQRANNLRPWKVAYVVLL